MTSTSTATLIGVSTTTLTDLSTTTIYTQTETTSTVGTNTVSSCSANCSQASVGTVISTAQQTLTIGGSTTIYPVTQAAIAAFERQYPGIIVQDAQGGGAAGMKGVTTGALDIGAASSLSAVISAQISDESLVPPVQLVATEIGGTGVVVIENGLGAGGFLSDGANVCQAISQGALALIFAQTSDASGYFTVSAGGCAAGILSTAGVTANVAAGTAGAIQAISRSDLPSGTEDTFSAYIGVSDAKGLSGVQEAGNTGVLAQAQKALGTNNPGGSIGFVDYGFATGAALGLTSGNADGVAIPQVYTTTVPVTVTLAVAKGASASSVGAAIFKALKQVATNTSSYPDTGGSLVSTFYYVTNGNPTPAEADFINFIATPSAVSFFTSQGYFSFVEFGGS
ncbi:MAG: substrate-binding domain-containing protein [Thaumarchaeota archaeon]|nr:substrate-binding domain-containing protein [Nitrososphaerota archaeon]